MSSFNQKLLNEIKQSLRKDMDYFLSGYGKLYPWDVGGPMGNSQLQLCIANTS